MATEQEVRHEPMCECQNCAAISKIYDEAKAVQYASDKSYEDGYQFSGEVRYEEYQRLLKKARRMKGAKQYFHDLSC
jgi:hypothetical protein